MIDFNEVSLQDNPLAAWGQPIPDLQSACQKACSTVGIEYRDVPHDGAWHATSSLDGHHKNGNGRIQIFPDGSGGHTHNWANGDKPVLFWAKADSNLTPGEIEERKLRIKEESARRDQELKVQYLHAAEVISRVLDRAKPATDSNPYLLRKGVKATPTMWQIDLGQLNELIGYHPFVKGRSLAAGEILLLPIQQPDGSVPGLEMIDSTGLKPSLRGGKKGGGFWTDRPLPTGSGQGITILIGEGCATVLSGVEAVPGSHGVAALCCSNLKSVAAAMRGRFPSATIVILSDLGNGQRDAEAAAKACGGLLALPELPSGTAGTDWNDLHQAVGRGEVARQIGAAILADEPESWQPPLLFGEIDSPEIPTSLLPEPLARYAQAVSDSVQTPPGMAVMMALSAVATCLQKRFEVCPFGDSYTEPVNVMTVTSMEPASRKSAVVTAMTGPLTEWETQQEEATKVPRNKIKCEREIIIKTVESIKSQASKAGTTDEGRQEALRDIKQLEDAMPPEIFTPKLWVDDTTPERLQGLMAENGERMAIVSAEGGLFEVIAGLYSGGNSNINVLLQSHAGEPVRVERQGRSVTMLKPALTLGLCVQPSVISDLASGNKARFRGNGMLARLLYCVPKSTVGTRDLSKRQPVLESTKAEYRSLIFRLLCIPPVLDEQGHERARMLTLAPDALKSWLTFAQYIESNQGQYGELHSIQDWSGKLPGAALRIAGLCHVVEYGEQASVINKATVEKALDLAELLIVHAKAAFALMGADRAIPDAKFVLQWIIKNGEESFRRNEIHRALHGKFQRIDSLKAALQVLTERHIISESQERKTGKRPEVFHRVNPAVLKGGNHGMA